MNIHSNEIIDYIVNEMDQLNHVDFVHLSGDTSIPISTLYNWKHGKVSSFSLCDVISVLGWLSISVYIENDHMGTEVIIK